MLSSHAPYTAQNFVAITLFYNLGENFNCDAKPVSEIYICRHNTFQERCTQFALRLVLMSLGIELCYLDSPDSKVHGANMGPIWGRQDSGRPHVGPMNFAIWENTIRGSAGWGKADLRGAAEGKGLLHRLDFTHTHRDYPQWGSEVMMSNILRWRHNERDGASNHWRLDGLLNRLFRRRYKKKHQSSASLAFVRGNHRWPMNLRPVTRKIFLSDGAIISVLEVQIKHMK